MGRRRNGPQLYVGLRVMMMKTTATAERNEEEKKRISAGMGTFPSPSWGGGSRYWKNAYGILRMNYDVGPTSNDDVGTTSFLPRDAL